MSLLAPGARIKQDFDMTIVEKIAEGGMGEVYEAILHGAQGFEKRIAVKVVRTEFLTGADSATTQAVEQEFLEKLVNEAKLVSNLIHTHIVQIYVLGILPQGENRSSGYIAMEYVHGLNLRSLMDRVIFDQKFIPVEIAVYIASRVARALEYAHTATDKAGTSLGIVHRDVSPTNILISVDGVAKLSDFGIARVLKADTAPTEYVVGKRRYMAPEQELGEDVDFHADIYSLGLVLFEMLTNHLPEKNLPTGLPTGLRADIPSFVEELVMRATRRHASERFTSTTEFAVALERAIYEKGYGPTFVTLADYVRDLFPGLMQAAPHAGSEERTMVFRAPEH